MEIHEHPMRFKPAVSLKKKNVRKSTGESIVKPNHNKKHRRKKTEAQNSNVLLPKTPGSAASLVLRSALFDAPLRPSPANAGSRPAAGPRGMFCRGKSMDPMDLRDALFCVFRFVFAFLVVKMRFKRKNMSDWASNGMGQKHLLSGTF